MGKCKTHSKFLEKMGTFFSCVKHQADKSDFVRRKLVIVGNGECGKTSLITRMATGNWVDNGYLPTAFETEVVEVNTGEETVELIIYDTAGQEDYDRLRPLSYNDVDVAIICFSLAEPDSLANVHENWSPEIRHFCGDVPVILVGNKKDLCTAPAAETSSRSSASSLESSASASATPSKSIDEIQASTEKVNIEMTRLQSDDVISKKDGVSLPSSTTPFGTVISTATSGSTRSRFPVHAPVKHSEGAFTAKRIGAMAYFETSALTGENAEEVLLAISKAAVLGSKKSRKFKPFTDTLKSWGSTSALDRR